MGHITMMFVECLDGFALEFFAVVRGELELKSLAEIEKEELAATEFVDDGALMLPLIAGEKLGKGLTDATIKAHAKNIEGGKWRLPIVTGLVEPAEMIVDHETGEFSDDEFENYLNGLGLVLITAPVIKRVFERLPRINREVYDKVKEKDEEEDDREWDENDVWDELLNHACKLELKVKLKDETVLREYVENELRRILSLPPRKKQKTS